MLTGTWEDFLTNSHRVESQGKEHARSPRCVVLLFKEELVEITVRRREKMVAGCRWCVKRPHHMFMLTVSVPS